MSISSTRSSQVIEMYTMKYINHLWRLCRLRMDLLQTWIDLLRPKHAVWQNHAAYVLLSWVDEKTI